MCWVKLNMFLQGLDDLSVILSFGIVVDTSCDSGDSAGPVNATGMYLYDSCDQLFLFAGPQPFFEMTSFKM